MQNIKALNPMNQQKVNDLLFWLLEYNEIKHKDWTNFEIKTNYKESLNNVALLVTQLPSDEVSNVISSIQ